MNWLRKILRITRLHRIRNEDIRNRLQQEVTLNDRIQKKNRLSWFGHNYNKNESKATVTKDALLRHREKAGREDESGSVER